MTINTFHRDYNRETQSYNEVSRSFAEGVTLCRGSRSAQIMSDVWDTEIYALYWDEESQSVKSMHLYYAYESGETERKSNCVVDATPEVWEKVQKFYEDREYDSLAREARSEANRIVKDSKVKVTGGRYNKGAEGKVVAIIQRPYGMGYRSVMADKIGIATSDVMIKKVVGNKIFDNYRDMVWVWARNCELTEVPEIDTNKIRESAAYRAAAEVKRLKIA